MLSNSDILSAAFVSFFYSLAAMAIHAAIAWAIGEALKKRPKIPSAEPSNVEVPQTKEGRFYGVIFGTPKRVMSPTVAWWGGVYVEPIRRHFTYNKWGNNKRKYYYIGYNYYVGVHFKLCHGPIDGVKQIGSGDKVAWPNMSVPTQMAPDGVTSSYIEAGGLFGGDERGGGIKGYIDIQYGSSTQTVNGYLSTMLGSNISASRGIVSVIAACVRMGTNPQLKPWWFLCKRTDILDDGSPQWYLSKADISGDLNAAHILRECYTNTKWGLGYSVSLIDETSWAAAADTLYTEGFGLSRYWYDENEDIEDLIDDIKRTINGTIYQDPETGLFVLKLARDDYVVDELESFDESDIEDIDDFFRPVPGEIPDVVNVRITDVMNNSVTPIPDHDIAMMDVQGGKSISLDMDFLAVTKPALGGKIAARERQQATSMLAPMTIKGKRTMSHIRPFDVFKITYGPLKIVQLVVRVMDVDYGTLKRGQVILHCTEDVFAMQDAIFSVPPETGWTDPISDPAVCPNRLLLEAPFWTLVEDTGISIALLLDDGAGFLLVAAQRPSPDALDFELLLRDSPTSDFDKDGRGYFSPTATIVDDLPMNADEVEIELNNVEILDSVKVDSYAQINDEIVKVTAIDTANNKVTVARGILDTVPAAHSASDRIWFIESCYMAGTEYSDSDQPGVKILPRTGKGQLDEGDATAYNATAFDSRAVRPYPPGNFKIDGVSYPSEFSGEPVLTWAHRDRTQQSTLIEHDNGNIGPEAGTTYTIKIYDAGDTLRTTVTGLTGTTYTYTNATEISDCGSLQTQLRFQLYAVRDGYDSWQMYDLTVLRRLSGSGSIEGQSSVSGKGSMTLPASGTITGTSNVSGSGTVT